MAGPVVVVVGRRVEKEAAVRKFLFFCLFPKSCRPVVWWLALLLCLSSDDDLTWRDMQTRGYLYDTKPLADCEEEREAGATPLRQSVTNLGARMDGNGRHKELTIGLRFSLRRTCTSSNVVTDEPEQQRPKSSDTFWPSARLHVHHFPQFGPSFFFLLIWLEHSARLLFRGEQGERGRSVISHPWKGAGSRLTVRLHDFPTLFLQSPPFSLFLLEH